MFRYRLAPNKMQRDKPQRTLDGCRFLYNCALEQRRSQHIGVYEHKRQLTEVRHSFTEYKDIHVHVLQNTLFKLDRAFQAFFRRCRNGEKPGFPRFKNANRFDSFAFNNEGFKLQGKISSISKIGNMKVRLSRSLPKDSTIKALTCLWCLVRLFGRGIHAETFADERQGGWHRSWS
jgi:putative transposase